MVTPEPINFSLLADLAEKSHPLLHIADDFERQIREIPIAWTGEVFQQARTAHHLLDMVDVPAERGYASDLDSRTYLAVRKIIEVGERLDRIQSWHSRESGPAGTVGDYCTECGTHWPCDTQRMAAGTYDDDRTNENLSRGLCGNRDEHDPHVHKSATLGTFWCHADQTTRLPFAAEARRKQSHD